MTSIVGFLVITECGCVCVQVCRNCDGDIEAGEMAVAAAKLDDMILWHAACFTCADCHELLVNLCYCCKDGNIYCERHYAELVRPRCAACDEVLTRSSSKSDHNA